MYRKLGLLNFIMLCMLASITTAAIAMDASLLNLLEMSDQIDKSEKQDFQAAIDKASACTRARNFPCAESELAKAKKVASSGQDKKILLLSQNSLANERQQLASEIRQAEEEREAQLRREEDRRMAAAEEEIRVAQLRADQAARQQENSEPSTASQLLLFGSLVAQNYQANKTAANMENMIRSQNFNRMQADVQANLDRQQQRFAEQKSQIAAERQAREQANAMQLAAAAQTKIQAEAQRLKLQQERESKRLEDEKRNQVARDSMERRRVAVSTVVLPKYQPQTVTLAKADLVCPPGWTWHDAAGVGAKGGTCYADPQAQGQTQTASNSNSNPDRPLSASGTTTRPQSPVSFGGDTRSDTPPSTGSEKKPSKVEWGPIKLEAFAICRQSTKNMKWVCNGPLDNQIIVDEPTLESALARQHCAGGTWAAGGPILKDIQWDAYRCGHSLGWGDYDIIKRYGMISAPRSYICPKYQSGDGGRCTTIYDGQDKR